MNVLEKINYVDNADYNTLDELGDIVNSQINSLSEFKDADFTDNNILITYQNYLKGLYKIKDSLKNDYMYVQHINVLDGVIMCEEQLAYLYYNYGFMNNNKEILEDIYEIEPAKTYLDAMLTIAEGINQNQGDMYNYWDGNTWYVILENNTKYSFDVTFEIEHMNKDKVVVEREYASVQRVSPNEKYAIVVPYSVALYKDYPWFYIRNFSIDTIHNI